MIILRQIGRGKVYYSEETASIAVVVSRSIGFRTAGELLLLFASLLVFSEYISK
jgi:hypothetical protein